MFTSEKLVFFQQKGALCIHESFLFSFFFLFPVRGGGQQGQQKCNACVLCKFCLFIPPPPFTCVVVLFGTNHLKLVIVEGSD